MKKDKRGSKTAKTKTSNISDSYDCCWDPSHEFRCGDSTCCC